MIRISKEQLEESQEIVQQAKYVHVIYWLWEKWEDIPWEDASRGDGMVKLREVPESSSLVPLSISLGASDYNYKRREIVKFREIFESTSPAFYGKFLEFSDYKRIIQDYHGSQAAKGNYQQIEFEQSIQMEIHGLKILAQVSLFVLYPLFLTNNKEFPFLLPDEIKEGEKNFSFDVVREGMRKINPDWCEKICQIFDNPTLSSTFRPVWPAWCEKYKKTIFLLIWFFLRGVQKTQLSSLSEAPQEEKEEFFREIENELNKKG